MIRLLVEGLLSSTLLAGVVSIVCLLGPRMRLSPAACHALWLVVLIKLMLPPAFAWPWALHETRVSTAHADSSSILQEAEGFFFDRDQPRPASNGMAAAPTAPVPAPRPSQAAPTGATPPPAPAAPQVAAGAQPWFTAAYVRAALLAIWLAGGASMLLLQALRVGRLRRLLRKGACNPHLTAQVAAVSAHLAIAPPRALVIPHLDSPYVCALFRPVVLWPADLDPRTAAASGLLAHELAHLRRRDHWVGWLILLGSIVWWWHPIYWLARRRLHRYAELCCDAWAVRILKDARRSYASALIDVSARVVARRVPALALGVRATRHELEGRLTMIMTGNPKIRPGLAAWALAATLLALTLPAWSQATTQATVPFSISPETTNIAQPLLADGTPDYLAVLNAKYAKGVTPENNAFIPFMKIRGTAIIFPDAKTRPEILKLLGTQESPPDEAHYSTFATYLTNHPSAIKPDEGTNIIVAAEREMWTATDHPELAAYLQAQGPIFDRLIEASKLPHFYAPFCSPTGNLVEVPVPRAAGLVEIFRAWITRPTLRAATGDIDGAAADLRAMKQLARLLPRQGTIIFTLLGYVADNIATDAAGIIAASGKLTAAQCDTLARALDLPPMPNLADIYNTNERWRALQLFQWTFKGKFREAYGSDLTAQQAATFNSIDWQRLDGDAFLKEFNIFRDREVALYASTNRAFIAALAKSLGEDVKQWADDAKKRGDSLAPDVGESKADYTTRIMHSIVSITTPRTYAQSANLLDRQFLSDMLPTLFAAAKFKAQTGAWPVSLNQLVPGYIKEIPADPYGANSAPIQYTLIDGHPRLFSIGPDRAPGTSDDLAIGQPLPPPATLPTPPTPPATRSDLP